MQVEPFHDRRKTLQRVKVDRLPLSLLFSWKNEHRPLKLFGSASDLRVFSIKQLLTVLVQEYDLCLKFTFFNFFFQNDFLGRVICQP